MEGGGEIGPSLHPYRWRFRDGMDHESGTID